MTKHNQIVASIAMAVATFGLGTSLASAAYPDRPVSLVVPFAPGGGSDILARMLAEKLESEWKQPVVVVNKPGAGGQIGTQYLAAASPDGYTIGVTTSGTVAVNPNVYKQMRYDSLKSFNHITVLADVPFVLTVTAGSKFTDLASLIKHAKAHPGEISLSNAGIGSHQYLAAHQLASKAGIELNMIPYSGGPAMTTDLLGGSLDSVLDNTMVQLPFLSSGKVRALGVSSASRAKFLPDVPTLSEAGAPDYKEIAWFGLAAPAGTPAEVIRTIEQATSRILKQPEVTKRLADMGASVVASTPEEAKATIEKDLKHFANLVTEIGLEPL